MSEFPTTGLRRWGDNDSPGLGECPPGLASFWGDRAPFRIHYAPGQTVLLRVGRSASLKTRRWWRPVSFTAYIAASALRSSSSTVRPPSGKMETPTLSVRLISRRSNFNWLRGVANDLLAAALHVLGGAEIGHHDDELVSAHARHGIGFTHRGQQASPHIGEQDVAIGMPKCVVNLLEVTDVDEEYGNLPAVVLRAVDRLAQTLVEKRAVAKAGQLVVICEIVDVIGAAPVLSHVAAGHGETIADLDDLNVQPTAEAESDRRPQSERTGLA